MTTDLRGLPPELIQDVHRLAAKLYSHYVDVEDWERAEKWADIDARAVEELLS